MPKKAKKPPIKLDVDHEITRLERNLLGVPGSTLTRVLIARNLASCYGLTEKRGETETEMLWCFALGVHMQPKQGFYYGRTIREAVLQAVNDHHDDRKRPAPKAKKRKRA